MGVCTPSDVTHTNNPNFEEGAKSELRLDGVHRGRLGCDDGGTGSLPLSRREILGTRDGYPRVALRRISSRLP
jgi:hypothetical protein